VLNSPKSLLFLLPGKEPDSLIECIWFCLKILHSVRQHSKFSINYLHLKQSSLFLKTIRDWNQLPANTTSADTIEGFRAALKSSTGRKWTTLRVHRRSDFSFRCWQKRSERQQGEVVKVQGEVKIFLQLYHFSHSRTGRKWTTLRVHNFNCKLGIVLSVNS
jgi:hypothetical protein